MNNPQSQATTAQEPEVQKRPSLQWQAQEEEEEEERIEISGRGTREPIYAHGNMSFCAKDRLRLGQSGVERGAESRRREKKVTKENQLQ